MGTMLSCLTALNLLASEILLGLEWCHSHPSTKGVNTHHFCLGMGRALLGIAVPYRGPNMGQQPSWGL